MQFLEEIQEWFLVLLYCKSAVPVIFLWTFLNSSQWTMQFILSEVFPCRVAFFLLEWCGFCAVQIPFGQQQFRKKYNHDFNKFSSLLQHAVNSWCAVRSENKWNTLYLTLLRMIYFAHQTLHISRQPWRFVKVQGKMNAEWSGGWICRMCRWAVCA